MAGGVLLLAVLLVAGAGPAGGPPSAVAGVRGSGGSGVDPPGSWSWPLAAAPGRSGPPVLRRFAVLPSPWLPGHRGVDLATAVGRPVLAPADGVVVVAATVVDRGVLTLRHASGLRTSYEPVSGQLPVGSRVGRGALVAVVGTGADHCPVGTCLHWGLRRGDVYLDPLPMVRQRPAIVLLPHAAGRSTPPQ